MSPLLVCSAVYLHRLTGTSSQAQASAASASARLRGVIRKVSRVPIIGVQNSRVPACLGPD